MLGRALLLLLDLALIAALAVALAYCTWAALAPRAKGATSLTGDTRVPEIATPAAHALFGAAATAAAPVAPSGLRLVGVIAHGPRGDGRALFALQNGRSSAAVVGGSISAGLVLQEVHSDHVLVSRDGAIERLTLERRAGR
jgi:hypothetical protein